MKQLFKLLSIIFLVITLSACSDNVDLPKKQPATKVETVQSDTETINSSTHESKENKVEEKESANTTKQSSEASRTQESSSPNVKKTAGTTEQIPVKLSLSVDGDTSKLEINGKTETVRYLLIDTPETNHPKLGVQPFGPEAKKRTTELLNSGQITIEYDIGERVDKYGRLLAYIYVDGKSVQETLLEEGLARVAYVYPPNTRYLSEFEAAEKRAKEKKIGIWSIDDYVSPKGFNSSQETSNNQSSNAKSSQKPTESKETVQTVKEQAEENVETESIKNEEKESYKNCTELRKVYPNGVPQDHPAYESKHDRDKDGWACEK